MSLENATEISPKVCFAAVRHVLWGQSDDSKPEAVMRPGGVMLCELVAGEFAIIVTGSSYSVTVTSMMIAADWEIIPDNASLTMRWAPRPLSGGKSWTYLRFYDQVVYADFNRCIWDIYHQVTVRRTRINSTLHAITYDEPSKFTKYCREYLGDDYFDNLPSEEDSSEADDAVDGTTMRGED
ncbi:hypothetical protein C8Q76DRAFT_798745 [Earliella scabrosa]|nr:hypothetical protein C8Q76DRAFT_798745 [Earliella scabrosa]